MTPPVVWPARRVGDRLLCGRPCSPACRGEIARNVTGGNVTLPTGLVQEPPGSGTWVLNSRARRKLTDRFGPTGRKLGYFMKPNRDGPWMTDRQIAAVPFRRRCPVCNVLAEVTADLLH